MPLESAALLETAIHEDETRRYACFSPLNSSIQTNVSKSMQEQGVTATGRDSYFIRFIDFLKTSEHQNLQLPNRFSEVMVHWGPPEIERARFLLAGRKKDRLSRLFLFGFSRIRSERISESFLHEQTYLFELCTI